MICFDIGFENLKKLVDSEFFRQQFFPKRPSEKRTHHLNLVETTSETGWKNQLLFRDFLRTHTRVRDKYGALKRELAMKYADNRDEYTKRKSDFVMRTIEEAKQHV